MIRRGSSHPNVQLGMLRELGDMALFAAEAHRQTVAVAASEQAADDLAFIGSPQRQRQLKRAEIWTATTSLTIWSCPTMVTFDSCCVQ